MFIKFIYFIFILKAQKMLERQHDFMDKKILTPLLVYPEGTVTSGQHLLIFRAGILHSSNQ